MSVPEQGGKAPEEQIHVSPAETTDTSLTGRIQELEAALTEKTREAEATYQRLLRLGAEFENYKKRRAREEEEGQRRAQAQLLQALLPVLDNLERALEATKTVSPPLAAWVNGMEMIWKQFKDVLAQAGVKEIVAEGQPFDPTRHEAVEIHYTTDQEEGMVVSVLQKGYLFHGRVLRPAKVVVAKAPEATADNASGRSGEAEA
ncbi:MAG: nucleotide exchange factor GrpE [Nitrospinota bacterium]|nr:MAG: nucleotide exchange factor GrpE [Nitrospinota bacterium]